MNCIELLSFFSVIILVIFTLPISIWFCYKVVDQYERAIILRLGKIRPGPPKGPGMVFILPIIDVFYRVDLRVISFDVPTQEALTKDAVSVSVDAVVYYRIADPVASILKVANFSHATFLLAMTMLRNMLGVKTLAEILVDRESLSKQLQIHLDLATDPWGVKVERVEIKDVRLPVNMQRAMAAEAEASQEARAKVIDAEGELKASKTLKEAADIIGKSPGAMQLRYLQTLNTISAERNSTVIFPLPMDIIAAFIKR